MGYQTYHESLDEAQDDEWGVGTGFARSKSGRPSYVTPPSVLQHLEKLKQEGWMIDDRTRAAMVYLDEAQPRAEPWSYGDARRWIDESQEREAKALRAALEELGLR